jgi:glycosyltransferase involved in cell wall biosynthesis
LKIVSGRHDQGAAALDQAPQRYLIKHRSVIRKPSVLRVFLSVRSLLPSFGGPAFSVSGLAVTLAKAGHEIGLWTPDQSAAATPLLPVNVSVQRLRGTESEAMQRFGQPDVLHDNGIWLPHNHRLANLAARRNIPRIVSTRGMLEPWALNHKRWRKLIAWRLYQCRDLYRAGRFHATAASEAKNLQALGLGTPIDIIPNGVDVPEPNGRFNSGTSGRRRPKTALFVGRINPKKGLLLLIQAWDQVRPSGWRLHIAGPDESNHQAQVEGAVSAAGLEDIITFLGPISGEAKKNAFFDAALFVLPTYSENFGIVVAEALAHGLPVLTTTGTPWSMLPACGCGWCVDPTLEGFAKGLREATSQGLDALHLMGAKGRELVAAEYNWEAIGKRFIVAYEAMGRQSQIF